MNVMTGQLKPSEKNLIIWDFDIDNRNVDITNHVDFDKGSGHPF